MNAPVFLTILACALLAATVANAQETEGPLLVQAYGTVSPYSTDTDSGVIYALCAPCRRCNCNCQLPAETTTSTTASP